MNHDSKAPAERERTNEFELPPDPMAKWELRPVALVTPPRHIREGRDAEISRAEWEGMLDRLNARLVNWLRRYTD